MQRNPWTGPHESAIVWTILFAEINITKMFHKFHENDIIAGGGVMDIKATLEKMHEVLRRLNTIGPKLVAAAGAPGEVRAVQFDRARGGKRVIDVMNQLGELEGLAAEQAELLHILDECRAKVVPLIDAMPYGSHRLMLQLRYVHGMSVQAAARSAGYERRYAYKLLAEGEKRLAGVA